MSNNPMDFPKSKIPVPESPYLSASRSGYLADLSDQVFFDESVPTPVDPVSKRPKSPPYSYGPPGILHDPSVVPGPSGSPRARKGRRRRPPDITQSEYVDSRLEELLGPTATLDVDDSVDDILIDSIQRRSSREREPKDLSLYPGRYSDRSDPRKKRTERSPISRSHEKLSDSLGIPGDLELLRKEKSELSLGRLKDAGSRPESRASEKPSSRPPSDKPSGAAGAKAPTSPKKSPLKQIQKAKDVAMSEVNS